MSLKHKIYIAVLIIVSAALIYALIKGPPKFETPVESFTLIYTNNLESKLLETDRIESVDSMAPSDFANTYMNLALLKTEAGNRNEPVIFLDCGNTLAGDEDIFRLATRNPMARLLYEVPYNGILFRDNEFLMGINNLKKLERKFPYLGMNIRNAGGGQAFITNAIEYIQVGDLKIALIGYYVPPESQERAVRRYRDFKFRDEIEIIRAVLQTIRADAKILLVSSPNIERIAREVSGFDLIISGAYDPRLGFKKITRIGENEIAPVIDSRFFIGKVRFVRKKIGKKKKRKKNPWNLTAAVKAIQTIEEVPPGGILNVVLDARQNMEVKYRGKYRAIYDTLVFWAPDDVNMGEIKKIIAHGLNQKYGTDAVLVDLEKMKLPETQAWGTRDILDLPGKTLNLNIITANESLVKKLKDENPKLTYFNPTGKKEGEEDHKTPESSPDFFLLVDRDAIKEMTLQDLKNLKEVPVPGNFTVLDYFRNNRGEIYIELTGGKTPFKEALIVMDDRLYPESADLLKKEKPMKKSIDGLVYMGICYFKGGDFKKALIAWKDAEKIAPKNPGLKKILTASPRPRKKVVKKSSGKVWRKFRGDPQNTGRIKIEGPSTNLLKWKFEALDKVMSSPVIGPDGTIYIGGEDFHLYALKPTGELKWKYKAGLPVRSSAVVGPEGRIYFGSDDKNLYCLSPDGKKIWAFQGDGYFSSSPTIGKDGVIYSGNEDFGIYAVSPGGRLKWKFRTEGVIFSSPALAKDGAVYIGSEDHFLYSINPDGRLKWKFETKHKINASPAVGSDGTIYVGSEDRSFYAIHPDGKLKWKTELDNYISSSPAIGSDGTIYTGCEDKNIYAISPDGRIKWKFETRGEIISSPLVDGAGNIYVGSDDGNLYSITPGGRKRWVFMARDPIMSSPALGPDGTLYAGCEDRNVYAIGE